MLIAAMVGLDTRTTMDLDATLRGQDLTESQIVEIFREILEVQIDDNVRFDANDLTWEMAIKALKELCGQEVPQQSPVTS
jgi:hypothetical protein